MKMYKYMAPPNPGRYEPVITYMSDQDILYDFWDQWKYKMEEKYGKDSEEITPENCVKDWVVMYHASEVKD